MKSSVHELISAGTPAAATLSAPSRCRAGRPRRRACLARRRPFRQPLPSYSPGYHPGRPRRPQRVGTYGFIKGATGFLLGAVKPGPHDMEDYGYLLEHAVLEATTWDWHLLARRHVHQEFLCRRIDARPDEVVPAVIAAGYPTETSRKHWLRRGAGSERRLPPEKLFFDERPDTPLDPASDGHLAGIVEAVRWAPSASNKQPWRLIRGDGAWPLLPGAHQGLRQGSAHLTGQNGRPAARGYGHRHVSFRTGGP